MIINNHDDAQVARAASEISTVEGLQCLQVGSSGFSKKEFPRPEAEKRPAECVSDKALASQTRPVGSFGEGRAAS